VEFSMNGLIGGAGELGYRGWRQLFLRRELFDGCCGWHSAGCGV